MRKLVCTSILIAGTVVAGHWIKPVRAQQEQTQQGKASTTPDAETLTPPPAYTPRPKGAPPIEDTPAQRDAIARWKAKAEQATAAARTEHNAAVTPAYNFHYGKKNPYTPGNIAVQGEGFIQPGAFPSAEYCG